MTSPDELLRELPLPRADAGGVENNRGAVARALQGRDERLVAIVGPCSLHDPTAALEYGGRLARLASRLGDRLLLVMRAYPEKSRTALGWRGLAEEPGLRGERDPEQGIRVARALLVKLASLGLPLAAEIVSPYLWRYWEDCLSWAAIGARGVEAQYLRELASSLPFPVAFKNGLDGSYDSALNAALVASRPCRFAGMDRAGRVSVVEGRGNACTQICLRGGQRAGVGLPNWDRAAELARRMKAAGLAPAVLIDAGHGNAVARRSLDRGGPSPQAAVLEALARTLKASPAALPIRGFMVESNLEAGRQSPGAPEELRYGVSITDECLAWDETERLLGELAAAL